MLPPLTHTQARVLTYIVAYQTKHQRPPARQDIAQHFGWRSVNAAEEHVQRLRVKGYVALPGRGDHSFRNIRVLQAPAMQPRCAPGASVDIPCTATNEA